jgi:5'-AMP-activated protein kinase catalytic alpha subunit
MHEQSGTPAYIAPEVIKDEGYKGFASDIWSCGIVLYALLYGTVPFKAGNINDLKMKIIASKYKLKEGLSKGYYVIRRLFIT